MVLRHAILALLVGAGAGFQAPRACPARDVSMSYTKTRREMRLKYPKAGKVNYVLTKDAPPYGKAGDVLPVARGFAINYLRARGLGKPASGEEIAAFEVKKAERAAAAQAAYDAAAETAQTLMALGDVSIARAADDDGAVAAPAAADVLQVLAEKSKVDLGDATLGLPTIDGFGEYPIVIKLHKDLKINMNLQLVAA
mmetsp:Transcript_15714/g.46882  ORF Transcript_15714/g.46882 Transcript_15714/m.46882 type:complete len:197 (-) Transcript_15714:42-632(-)|eukprot:CAMPEP_0119267860 /NCGR_PEP_ID=MMETSP1329-20130426/5844_1 /TAXON_ID=114041 /ORGANISM="Genus nov. species nov., Strain RCC1024" /LENGTH=196 /DNA_ID=CAMNT_0007267801 /DNA_START=148 /DNA_END=738 /DNA_ORIENTATION=-